MAVFVLIGRAGLFVVGCFRDFGYVVADTLAEAWADLRDFAGRGEG